MPSYYDSTKKKPGTAKVKYNEGGLLEGAMRKGKGRFWLVDEDGKPLKDGVKAMPLRKGGKVKKMKGGGTVARGSGAARPQAFHKNG